MAKNGSDFLSDIEDRFNEVLGAPDGTIALREILKLHAGTEIYIPSKTETFIAYRDEQIRSSFDGSNYAELARLWHLSSSQIRTIVHR